MFDSLGVAAMIDLHDSFRKSLIGSIIKKKNNSKKLLSCFFVHSANSKHLINFYKRAQKIKSQNLLGVAILTRLGGYPSRLF